MSISQTPCLGEANKGIGSLYILAVQMKAPLGFKLCSFERAQNFHSKFYVPSVEFIKYNVTLNFKRH